MPVSQTLPAEPKLAANSRQFSSAVAQIR